MHASCQSRKALTIFFVAIPFLLPAQTFLKLVKTVQWITVDDSSSNSWPVKAARAAIEVQRLELCAS
jgi:hypothetical protein